MDAAGYVALTRQAGLWREISVVANNIANSSTHGFRREGVVFSEHISRAEGDVPLSSAYGNARWVDQAQGDLIETGGDLDIAIEGEGYFLVETPQGQRLTRSGAFLLSGEGEIVTPQGFALLDAAGAPILVPANVRMSLSEDGNLSSVDGPIAQIALWHPIDPSALRHASGTLFSADDVEPIESGQLRQGYLEGSNVNPLSEIARLVEVQRAYEMAQKFLDAEDSRTRSVIQRLGG